MSWLLCSGLHAAHVRRADLTALLDLYRILGGEQWKQRGGWDITGVADPCTTHWHGVGCDDPCDAVLDATVLPRGVTLLDATRTPCRKGRITSIRLRDNWLHGNISSWHSVAELHQLSHLDLSLNGQNLTGSLPSQLSTLRNLDFLDVSSNALTGHLPDFSAINGAAKRSQANASAAVAGAGSSANSDDNDNDDDDDPFELDTANFANNLISGTVPAALGLHTKLALVDIGFNALSGSLPSTLGELGGSLEVLYASANRLDGTLPTQIGRLERLRYLHADRNAISGTLPSSLGKLRALRALQLSRDAISGSVPTQLGGASDLRSLKLNDNRLDGNLTRWESLGAHAGLSMLDLYNNSMSGELPASIARLHKLRFLYVDQTHLRPLTLFYCRERLPLPLHFGNKVRAIVRPSRRGMSWQQHAALCPRRYAPRPARKGISHRSRRRSPPRLVPIWQYNFKIVRDRYHEMASAVCPDPYDVNLAFNPLSAWGQYAD
jgi:hypothetical protein